MKLNFSINVLFLLFICCFISCKDEDDYISEPTATSTFIKGVARTSNGEPLANVLVKLDYVEGVWMGPQLRRHKAEGKTDKNGNYQIFFELKDDEQKQNDSGDNKSRNFQLIFNLDNLPKDAYFMPTDLNSSNEDQELFFSYSNNFFGKGKTHEHNLYVPRKRLVEVTVINHQPLGDNDKFAIRNWISYGGDRQPDNCYGESGLVFMDYPVELTEEELQTFKIPCAVNDLNSIALVNMDDAGAYETNSSIQKIYVTKDSPGSVQLVNNILSKQFKFKLKAWSDGRTVAPFEGIVFQITDADGKYSMGIPSSFSSYYDSIVWSANGYPDQMVIYKNPNKSSSTYTSQWDCYFFQNKPLYTRLQGYRNGRIMYTDSVETVIDSRDFLRYDWDDDKISIDNPHYVCYCPLYKDTEFHYYIPTEQNGHLYSKVLLVRNNNDDNDLMFTDRARKKLSGLMDYHLGERKSFDSTMVSSLFHCLPTGVKIIAYWQTTSTQAVLIEEATEDDTCPSIYIHAEAL